ncbi:MAG: MbnP family protein [Spirosomataceae bacterium]
MKKLFFACCFLVASLANAQKTGSLSIHFDNRVGSEDLVLNTKSYTNASGNEFKVSLFQYYVSNLELVRKDGSSYVVPQDESYFLVRENRPETQTITLNNIPKGSYVGLRFVIGVDSTRSASEIGQRKGCLDVGGEGKDMYWAWNSGYIFVKMEGTSPQIQLTGNRKEPIFMYHIGLFGGIGDKKTLNNIKQANLDFGGKLKIKAEQTAQIEVQADASKLFNGTTNVDLAKNPTVMAGPYSKNVADNYTQMFSFEGFKKETPKSSESKVALGMK